MNTDVQGGANFSILGMPGTSYRYTIDGLNDTDNSYNVQLAGSLFLLLGENQIQEATIVSTGYSGHSAARPVATLITSPSRAAMRFTAMLSSTGTEGR